MKKKIEVYENINKNNDLTKQDKINALKNHNSYLKSEIEFLTNHKKIQIESEKDALNDMINEYKKKINKMKSSNNFK